MKGLLGTEKHERGNAKLTRQMANAGIIAEKAPALPKASGHLQQWRILQYREQARL